MKPFRALSFGFAQDERIKALGPGSAQQSCLAGMTLGELNLLHCHPGKLEELIRDPERKYPTIAPFRDGSPDEQSSSRVM